jgi:hypothetical protein
MSTTPHEICDRCLKPNSLCLCAEIPPAGLASKRQVVLLQHPQEPDKELGSARLAHLALPGSLLKVGLSWPNLKTVLEREAQASRWAVLYLGSGIKESGPPPTHGRSGLVLVDKKGAPLPEQKALLDSLEGIVVLDGTWSQAKALWWRNAWLLKLRRAILVPARASLYQELRKEPRRECVSTIESVAMALEALGEPAETTEGLTSLFGKLLDRYRANRPRRPGQRGRFRPRRGR